MKILMIILQIIGGITLVPWFAVAGLSFMAFDAPNSTKKLMPWVFVLCIFSYPFIVGISYWRAWADFELGFPRGALIWSSVPLIIFVVAFFIITRASNIYDKLSNRKQ